MERKEPEKPTVYEPADLHGRKHVEKVTSEYRFREDECLADKLQSEEFELHFANNKSARRLGQIDLKTAKEIYLKEIEESGLLTKKELNQLCRDDNLIAKDIARRIQNEEDLEAQKKAAVEMQDEEFAKYLHAKEKERLERERIRKRERQIARDREAANRLQEEIKRQEESNIVVMKNNKESDDELYVEYNIRPSAAPDAAVAMQNDAEENLRRDAEYARRLQALEKEKYDRDMKRLRKIAQERDIEEQQIQARNNENNVESVRRDVEGIAISREKFITSPGKSPYRNHSESNSDNQNDVNPYETIRSDAHIQQKQKKKGSLRSVDATGQPVGQSTFYQDSQISHAQHQHNDRNSQKHNQSGNAHKDSNLQRQREERLAYESRQQNHYDSNKHANGHGIDNRQSTGNNHRVNKQQSKGEPIYLQAVDSKHSQNNDRPKDSQRGKQGQYYSNVAENIDPTFHKDRSTVRENTTLPQSFEPPVDAPSSNQASVIKNQKRPSLEKKDKKKKGSIFSKKK